MATLVTVAKVHELASEQGKLVEINQKRMARFNVGGHYYAIDAMCPDRGGPLSKGGIEGTTVVRPWYDISFDLETGAVTRCPAETGVATDEVHLEGEDSGIAV
jgi:3-phenylpropionate/trans-cinnamate dioxygenase ferredoxin component